MPNTLWRQHRCWRSGFPVRGTYPARATSQFAQDAGAAIQDIAGAAAQTLQYRQNRTAPWQALAKSFLHPAPPVEMVVDQHQTVLGPMSAVLFVPYTSALVRTGPNGGQVMDMDGVIWGCNGGVPGIAFMRYRMTRASSTDAGQVAGRL